MKGLKVVSVEIASVFQTSQRRSEKIFIPTHVIANEVKQSQSSLFTVHELRYMKGEDEQTEHY